ncbi:MAG: DEAD/DEAH box helicase [Bacteroidia bacterium]
MVVVNTQPFALIYTLIEHPHLGFLIEPHVVQLNGKGQFTLTHQRIFTKTSEYFSKNISSHDYKIIKLLDEIDDEYIFKKFNTETKKRIRKTEYFKKYFTKEIFEEKIRPFIEERLVNALQLLKGITVYKMGNDNNPTSVALKIGDTPANIWFHFKKNDAGFRYYPTIKYNGNLLEFKHKEVKLITMQPAWILIDNMLLDFEQHVEGKKLLPFLNKRFIQVPQATMDTYMRKFVQQVVEKYHVKSDCFQIKNQVPYGNAKLLIQQLFNNDIALKLTFHYNDTVFEYGSGQLVASTLFLHNKEYIFYKVERNLNFEEKIAGTLIKLGLKQYNGPYFTLPDSATITSGNALLSVDGTNKYHFLEWLNQHHETLKKHNIEVEQSEETTRYFFGVREIKIEVSEKRDWFDIKAVVKFGEYTFSFLALKDFILSGKREFILPNGLVAIIPEEWFGNLSGIIELNESATDDDIKLQKHHIGLLEELSLNNGNYLRLSDKLNKLLHYGSELQEIQLPKNFKGTLRNYQHAGYNWFYFLKENNFGGCLADDMGLGKTIQTLAMLQMESELYHSFSLNNTPIQNTFALVEPSESNNAERNNKTIQLDLFSQLNETTQNRQLHVQSQGVYHHSMDVMGSGKNKKDLPVRTSLLIVPNSLIYNWLNESIKFTPQLRILNYTGYNRSKNTKQFEKYDLVITTYGTVRVDIDLLKEYKFNYVILDESQAIKNPQSIAARSVKMLTCNHKLVLTGTPIENSIHELWSQFSFINPGLLGSANSFSERFANPIEKQQNEKKLAQLKAIIKPFILRRTKQQVATELPEKMEQVIYCTMTEEQAEAYEKVKSHYRNEVLKSIQEFGLSKTRFTLLQGLTKLRQIANHPLLTNNDFAGESGKFNQVKYMAETALAEGHKTLVFSQFVSHLKIVKDYFKINNIPFCYLDGSMNNEARQSMVQQFQQGNTPFFLISLKAGGFGLNLTEADYVFMLDPWWNPAAERQAIDRAHRIGQTQHVFIYKFISKDSVEEKILELQQKKQTLADNIITADESFVKQINADEILALLD